MNQEPKPKPSQWPVRLLGVVLLLGVLPECGRSVKGQGPSATSAAGTAATAGEAGAGAGDGAGSINATGGVAGGGLIGGGRSGGDGGSPIQFYACLHWSDFENEPIPGQSGPAACPRFSELRYTQAFRESYGLCYWEAAVDEALVPPPDVEPGDCCYGIGYLHCR